ncbi:MAG TPA: NnrS family protein [Candidatus Angelobacter sp.]
MSKFTEEMSVADVVQAAPHAREVFDRHGLKGCAGENGPAESIAFFAAVHQVDVDRLLGELNQVAPVPGLPYTYKEGPADVIYRRFFKTAIVTVLSVGCMWGAINLLEIALGGSFLQVGLLPAIHAHAQAMISGWVGLFVMGFAYQSFPRFKNTTLWRPDLANLSLYLVIIGVLARMIAELVAPAPVAGFLGVIGFTMETIAGVTFVAVLLKTARQSLEPRAKYEMFILGSLFWFLVQIPLSYVLFFAKLFAADERQMVMRIALIDGPLRDIQLLGFAALIIAGVSQRFVPLVYGLKPPRRDHFKSIFWIINGGLLLNVAGYVLLLQTFNPMFAIPLEISYLAMPVWAILLARQIGIFSSPQRPDRSFKFIRAAYVWLLVAAAMLPLFPVYGMLTHQVFAHSWMGAYRHAFTVGFISMMILGVSSRVVPILAAMDGAKLTSLWGPFILINLGNAGRVLLQILTDWFPKVAYSLLGFTGFIEVIALAWWGIHLWRVMNLARIHRPQALKIDVPLGAVR